MLGCGISLDGNFMMFGINRVDCPKSASIDAPSTEEWKPKNAFKNSYKAEETLITSTARLANQQNKIK